MATFHHDAGVVRMFVKGAPDVLLARASQWLDSAGETTLDPTIYAAFAAENELLAAQAMRVLAVGQARHTGAGLQSRSRLDAVGRRSGVAGSGRDH